MKKPEDICSDFNEWPYIWMGMKEDIPYGKEILNKMRPFIEYLIEIGLGRKTIRNHMDNLWLLGGEIIRDVSMHNDYKVLPETRLRGAIGLDGGPYCSDLNKQERNSFDVTCRKFHKFQSLKNSNDDLK